MQQTLPGIHDDGGPLSRGEVQVVEDQVYLVTINNDDENTNICRPRQDNIAIYEWESNARTFQIVQKLSVVCAADADIVQIGNEWFLFIIAQSPDAPSSLDVLRIYKKYRRVFNFHLQKELDNPSRVTTFESRGDYFSLVSQQKGRNSADLESSESVLFKWI